METVASFITNNSSCILCAVGIVVTILAIAVSTRYSLRNLLNINPISSDEIASESSDLKTREEMCDTASNDGDDEAEVDEDDADDDLDDKDSTHTPLSPRYPDPVEYCEHIQGEFKRAKQNLASRTIQKDLTDDQIQQEREAQQKQLSEIFRLMQEQHERFGISSMEDMQEQMKLYAI